MTEAGDMPEYRWTNRRWPRVADQARLLQSVLNLTLDEVYGCQEASGNVIGLVAGTALVATGTPTFRRTLQGRSGIYYDSTNERHAADVHAVGTSSCIYMVAFETVNAISGAGIMGRTNAGATDCLQLYQLATGEVQALIRDAGANSLALTSVLQATPSSGLWLAQVQMDKTGNTARSRLSLRGGTADAQSGSIAGFGTMNGAAMTFGLGSVPPFDGGVAVYWAAVATGAQCEGATLLARNAAALGFP